MDTEKTAVVFVHGLWLHATSWAPWIEKFGEAGYAASAPGWPGEPATVEAARESPDAVADIGVDRVVGQYASELAAIGGKPVVIGHSFGGVIAQRLLAEGHASAAIALDAAPIKGVIYLPPSALRVASVALRDPRNLKRAVALTRGQFRYGFGNALSEAESDRLYDEWTTPSPGRPLFEAAVANFAPKSPVRVDTSNSSRGPLLLVAGTQDHTVPPSITKTTYKLYGKSSAVTELREFDRGHSLGVDSGWTEIADACLAWLKTQGL